MKQTKLIQLLRTLSKEEFLRFGKFLKSPFFNYTPSLIKLYEGLKRYHPNFDSPRLKKEKLWEKAMPEKPFDERKFRHLCFYLSRIVEKYLIQLELEAQELKRQQLLIEALGKRNAYTLFEKKTLQLEQKLEDQPYKNAESYLSMTDLQYQHYAHPLTNKYEIKTERLKTIMDNLDGFYFSRKLRFGSELKFREKYFKEKYNNILLEEIKDSCESSLIDHNPLIKIYLLIHKLYGEEIDYDFFEEVKDLFLASIDKINPIERVNIFLHLINYVTGRVNSGEQQFDKVTLDLYKIGLHYHLVMENNRLPETIFTNIVSFGCHQKEFDWTQHFIKNYEQYLETEVRLDAKILSLILLHFWKEDYEKVIDLTENHKFSLSVTEIKARTYLLRAWFEKFLLDDDWLELLLYKIKAFEQFSRRDKTLATSTKAGYLNFAKLISQFVLLKNKNTHPKEAWSILKIRIEKEPRLIAKKWFLDKLKEEQ